MLFSFSYSSHHPYPVSSGLVVRRLIICALDLMFLGKLFLNLHESHVLVHKVIHIIHLYWGKGRWYLSSLIVLRTGWLSRVSYAEDFSKRINSWNSKESTLLESSAWVIVWSEGMGEGITEWELILGWNILELERGLSLLGFRDTRRKVPEWEGKIHSRLSIHPPFSVSS